jgi:hypothetical protein
VFQVNSDGMVGEPRVYWIEKWDRKKRKWIELPEFRTFNRRIAYKKLHQLYVHDRPRRSFLAKSP